MASENDRVCGMIVETSSAKYVAEHQGETYYFCGRGCQRAFEAKPWKYLEPQYRPSMLGAFVDWVRAMLSLRAKAARNHERRGG